MMHESKVSEESKTIITALFKSMEDQPSTNSDSLAMKWLKEHNSSFTSFVNGDWIPLNKTDPIVKVNDNFRGKYLADIQLPAQNTFDSAFASAKEAHGKWELLTANMKSRCLYNIARNIQKYLQLVSLMECISSGKHLYKTKAKDVPNLIQSFYHYAGCAQLAGDSGIEDRKPLGVVCVIAEEHNNPLMSLSWRASSILAAGNAVVLLTDKLCSLSAFIFAEICHESGLPPGMLNVLPIDQENLQLPDYKFFCDKIVFTGSHQMSLKIIEMAAVRTIDIDVHILRRPTIIIYEDADLSSAVNGVLETLFHNDTRAESSGCRLLVQESIQGEFLSKLEQHLSNVLVGSNLSKTDFSCIVTEEQYQKLSLLIEDAEIQNAKIFYGPSSKDSYTSWKPTLLKEVQTASRIVHEEIGGPVIISIPFRTVKESIAICNYNKRASDVSIWTEKLTIALEVSHLLKVGTVWVNSQNIIDATAGYGGVYKSGSAREGSEQALLRYSKPLWYKQSDSTWEANIGVDAVKDTNCTGQQDYCLIDHTYKLYYGGAHKRPSVNTSKHIYNHDGKSFGCVAEASGADVQSSISSAIAAQSKWRSKTGYNRAQILYYVAENLDKRKNEFSSDLHKLTGLSLYECVKEVEISVQRLFYWAAYADKYGGAIKETETYGQVLQTYEPLGVIAIVCPNEAPLLSFLSLIAPAVARGNAVVAVASENYPVPALKMCEVFDTSDVPGGVINVLTGDVNNLTRHLYLHMDVDAIWVFSSISVADEVSVRKSCINNLRRVWIPYKCDWLDSTQGQGKEFIIQATQSKTIYLPMGDIFAN